MAKRSEVQFTEGQRVFFGNDRSDAGTVTGVVTDEAPQAGSGGGGWNTGVGTTRVSRTRYAVLFDGDTDATEYFASELSPLS